MLKIRLQRVGRKHEPTFRVVLTDSKNSTKSGKFHEILGSYDPRKKTEVLHGDRIKDWMGKGAQLSGTVHNLLVSHKILDKKKINVLPKKSPVLDEEKIAAEKATAEAAEQAKADALKAQQEAEQSESAPESTPEAGATEEATAKAPEDAPGETAAAEIPQAEAAPEEKPEADVPVEDAPATGQAMQAETPVSEEKPEASV